MIIFINFVIALIYIMSIIWTWRILYDVPKSKKILVIIIGIFIIYLVTTILFNITKNKIDYENLDMQKDTRKLLIWLFSGVNSLLLPLISKEFLQIKGESSNEKNGTKILIMIIIIIICMIIEENYMKNIQQNIIDMYKNAESQQEKME